MLYRLPFVLLALAAILNGGCKSLLGKTESHEPKPTGEIAERTAPQLLGYLNTQAYYLHSISYKDVSVSASENGRDMPRLGSCTLDAQQPRNFRLNCGTNFDKQRSRSWLERPRNSGCTSSGWKGLRTFFIAATKSSPAAPASGSPSPSTPIGSCKCSE